MTKREFYQNLIIMAATAFTNTGGFGGAGIIIPIMVGLYSFDTKNAIALSNFSVSVSSFVRYIFHFNMSHPLKNGAGVAVDYNIITLMLPAAIVGASIGIIVNLVLPGPIILGLFITVSSITALTACKKFIKLRRTENDNHQHHSSSDTPSQLTPKEIVSIAESKQRRLPKNRTPSSFVSDDSSSSCAPFKLGTQRSFAELNLMRQSTKLTS